MLSTLPAACSGFATLRRGFGSWGFCIINDLEMIGTGLCPRGAARWLGGIIIRPTYSHRRRQRPAIESTIPVSKNRPTVPKSIGFLFKHSSVARKFPSL